jgi:molecular chaperone GrpE (heat shock protein)
MENPTPPTGQVENQTPPTPPVQESPPVENSTIKQLREEIKKRDAETKDLLNTVEELKRAQMSEEERKTKEVEELRQKASELDPLRDELGRYKSKAEQLFELEYQKVPDEHKERIDKLIGEGSPFDRLERLQTAIALLPSATQPPTQVGKPAGVRPTGSTTGNPDTRKPQEISWKDALKK